MNLHQVQYANKQRIQQVTHSGVTTVELCKVQNVNIENMTVDVELIESSRILTSVPFCLPARFLDKGILYIPEKGALGILATTTRKQSFIISFVSLSGLSKIGEDLLPGEILIQSKGYSFIKEDNSGNVIIGSPAGNFLVVGHKGNIIKSSETENTKTVAKEVVSGIVEGVVAEIEKIYDKDVTSELSIDEIVQKILNKEEVTVTHPTPVIIIEKGNVIDQDGQPLKLDIDANPDNNHEIALRITVKDSLGNDKFTISIDKAGRAKMSGDTLILDFNTFDYSACTNVISPV